MKTIFIIIAVVIITVLLLNRFGFRTQKPSDYTQTNPAFDITKQLGGPLLSEGVLFGPNGKVATRFVARMEGSWQDNQGILRETFTYDNGTVQNREWKITLGENGKFSATASDVIGTGEGEISGSTMVLRYKIKLTEAAGGHELDVIDWIYLTENGVMINKSEMRKFGVKVVELVGNIRPE